jgi:hypothetical protein
VLAEPRVKLIQFADLMGCKIAVFFKSPATAEEAFASVRVGVLVLNRKAYVHGTPWGKGVLERDNVCGRIRNRPRKVPKGSDYRGMDCANVVVDAGTRMTDDVNDVKSRTVAEYRFERARLLFCTDSFSASFPTRLAPRESGTVRHREKGIVLPLA